MRNKLQHLMLNLSYVKVDRAAARQHWWDLVSAVDLDPRFWAVNRHMLVSNKAVAGILSHRQTRGFVFHRIRERAIRRRLAA